MLYNQGMKCEACDSVAVSSIRFEELGGEVGYCRKCGGLTGGEFKAKVRERRASRVSCAHASYWDVLAGVCRRCGMTVEHLEGLRVNRPVADLPTCRQCGSLMRDHVNGHCAAMTGKVDYGASVPLPPDPALAGIVAASEHLSSFRAEECLGAFDDGKQLWFSGRPAHVEPADTRCPGCVEGGKGAMCVYCLNRAGMGPHPFREAEIETRMYSVQEYRNEPARARMALMDKRERVPETATRRELAKPHPWEEFE